MQKMPQAGPILLRQPSIRLRKTLRLDLVETFFHQIELIRLEIPKALFVSRRPRDLDHLCACRFRQAKVGAQIILRKIISSAGNFSNL
jgi:hypothetical protein